MTRIYSVTQEPCGPCDEYRSKRAAARRIAHLRREGAHFTAAILRVDGARIDNGSSYAVDFITRRTRRKRVSA